MRLKTEDIPLLPDESFRLLRWRDNLHDMERVLEDGSCRPFDGSGHQWHHHALMELTLILKGTGTRFIGDSIAQFDGPDLVLLGPGLPHYWHLERHTAGFAVQFDTDADKPLWRFPETRALLPFWSAAQRGLHLTGPAVARAAALFQEAAAQSGLARLACLLQLLDTVARTRPDERTPVTRATFAPPARAATYRSLQKAINLVFRRYPEDLRFADVLDEAQMCKATFQRHFKRHTGKSLTQFLAEVRLNAACRQLLETELTVGEIALGCGFGNISHFNHQFRAHLSLSPRAFRRTRPQIQ